MATVETEFNVGDKVWRVAPHFLIRSAEVLSISIDKKGVTYNVGGKGLETSQMEAYQLGASRQDLFEKLNRESKEYYEKKDERC